MDHAKIIRELRKIADKAPRDDFHGQTLRGLRNRGLVYTYWNSPKYYLTRRARKLLKEHTPDSNGH